MPAPLRITTIAPAKVNLTLEILGRRADGFHEVRSVMQMISLHDTLSFSSAPAGEVTLEGDMGGGADNLVLKAARLLRQETGARSGARIVLKKGIPVGAGLGGGSSDAAATLAALNTLWALKLRRADLMELGARLGSDVPFFFTGGTALAEGRGERLTPLPPLPVSWLVVARPLAGLSTPDVYRAFAAAPAYGTGQASVGLANALRDGSLQRPGDVQPFLVNDLAAPAMRLCPDVGVLVDRMRRARSVAAMMSGSGSAAFAMFADNGRAAAHARTLGRRGFAVLTHTVSLPWEEDT